LTDEEAVIVASSEPNADGDMITVRLDDDLCVGAGTCASLMPEIFEQTDNGKSVVRRPVVPAADLAEIDDVIDLCPVAAISASRVSTD
jgi:ferredoxin